MRPEGLRSDPGCLESPFGIGSPFMKARWGRKGETYARMAEPVPWQINGTGPILVGQGQIDGTGPILFGQTWQKRGAHH